MIYGAGSLTTALAPNLRVLLLGWSFLEGIGAVLIMPAIVALIASNFGQKDRPRAYGLVASASAIAVAVSPLIGGLGSSSSACSGQGCGAGCSPSRAGRSGWASPR